MSFISNRTQHKGKSTVSTSVNYNRNGIIAQKRSYGYQVPNTHKYTVGLGHGRNSTCISPSFYMYIYFASTHNVLLSWEVGGVSCTRKMVPVGEEREKLVTPLTDIQLLHPVTATMHAREGDRRGMRGKGRAGEEEEEEEVRKKERMEDGKWKEK